MIPSAVTSVLACDWIGETIIVVVAMLAPGRKDAGAFWLAGFKVIKTVSVD